MDITVRCHDKSHGRPLGVLGLSVVHTTCVPLRDIYIEPCQACIDEATRCGIEAGYEQGYPDGLLRVKPRRRAN